MMVSPSAASQMVDRLEKLDMVKRISDPTDRRVRKVLVLEKGERFVPENFIYSQSQSWLADIPTNITSEQGDQITAVLSILLQGAGENDQSIINNEKGI